MAGEYDAGELVAGVRLDGIDEAEERVEDLTRDREVTVRVKVDKGSAAKADAEIDALKAADGGGGGGGHDVAIHPVMDAKEADQISKKLDQLAKTRHPDLAMAKVNGKLDSALKRSEKLRASLDDSMRNRETTLTTRREIYTTRYNRTIRIDANGNPIPDDEDEEETRRRRGSGTDWSEVAHATAWVAGMSAAGPALAVAAAGVAALAGGLLAVGAAGAAGMIGVDGLKSSVETLIQGWQDQKNPLKVSIAQDQLATSENGVDQAQASLPYQIQSVNEQSTAAAQAYSAAQLQLTQASSNAAQAQKAEAQAITSAKDAMVSARDTAADAKISHAQAVYQLKIEEQEYANKMPGVTNLDVLAAQQAVTDSADQYTAATHNAANATDANSQAQSNASLAYQQTQQALAAAKLGVQEAATAEGQQNATASLQIAALTQNVKTLQDQYTQLHNSLGWADPSATGVADWAENAASKLGPNGKGLASSIETLLTDFSGLKKQTGEDLAPGLTEMVDLVDQHAPEIIGFIETMATHLGEDIGKAANKLVNDPAWQQFWKTLKDDGPGDFDKLIKTGGDFLTGAADFLTRFAPTGEAILSEVDKVGHSFDGWAKGSGPEHFFDYVAENGPKLASDVKGIADGLKDFATDMQPVFDGISELAKHKDIVEALAALWVTKKTATVVGGVTSAVGGLFGGGAAATEGAESTGLLSGLGAFLGTQGGQGIAGMGLGAFAGYESGKSASLPGEEVSIAGGAVGGAMLGSLIGPEGTMVGAAVGGLLALGSSVLGMGKQLKKAAAENLADNVTNIQTTVAAFDKGVADISAAMQSAFTTATDKKSLAAGLQSSLNGEIEDNPALATAMNDAGLTTGQIANVFAKGGSIADLQKLLPAGLSSADTSALSELFKGLGTAAFNADAVSTAEGTGQGVITASVIANLQDLLPVLNDPHADATALIKDKQTVNQILRAYPGSEWDAQTGQIIMVGAPGTGQHGPNGVTAGPTITSGAQWQKEHPAPAPKASTSSGVVPTSPRVYAPPAPTPARASGGPVLPGVLYQINEEGLEGFVPNVAGRVVSHDEMVTLAQIMAGNGGSSRPASYDQSRTISAPIAVVQAQDPIATAVQIRDHIAALSGGWTMQGSDR